MDILHLILALIAIIAVVFSLIWVINSTMPAKIQILAKMLVGVIAFVGLIYLLAEVAGIPLGRI